MSEVNGIRERNGVAAERSGLIVLGMHRSGTSAITGMLQLCGAWAGEDDELTAANIENPQGFWERRDVRKICDELLHSADADWWKVVSLNLKSIPHAILSEQRRRFQAAVSELEEHEPWVVKEPRLCLLLPILRDFLNKAVCVHVFRNPLEVAQSLQLRNGFSIAAGIALWETYNIHALRASRTMPRVMIEYGTLMRDPPRAIDQLVAQLGEVGVMRLAVPTESAIRQFIHPKYHRQRVTDDDTDRYLSFDQKSLWQQIQGEAVFTQKPRATISSAATQSLYDFESWWQSVTHHKDRITKINARLISRETELASLRKVVDIYREDMASLREGIDTCREEQASLRKGIDIHREEQASLQKGIDIYREEQASLQESINTYREEQASLQESINTYREEQASLQEGIDVRDRKLEELKIRAREVADRDKTIRNLRNSTSWKLTAPLRALSMTCKMGTGIVIRPFKRSRRATNCPPAPKTNSSNSDETPPTVNSTYTTGTESEHGGR